MHIPANRGARIATVVAGPLAILVAALMIWHVSSAAFSATTRNSGNSWSTGTVALTDDDQGAARFQVANMLPGQTDTGYIVVTANASVASTVKAYALNTDFGSGAGLENYIMISVQRGTGTASFSNPTGTFTEDADDTPMTDVPLGQFASTAYDWSTGASPWAAPVGTTSKVYKITWTFDTTGLTQTQLDALQGKHVGIDIQWEMQNNS